MSVHQQSTSTSTSASTPPTVPTESQLDALLTEYLHLLDRYTVLRAQLSTSLASGFLALAHANRNAAQSLGPGRRYGQDAYDTRMKAIRRVRISGQSSFSTTDTTATEATTPTDSDEKEEREQEQEQEKDQDQDQDQELDKERGQKQEQEQEKDKNKTQDPLRWFGLLVPPALRQCQSHFSNSVATTIPDLVTVIAEMGKAENEIAKLRRELGLDEGTKSQDAILPQPTKAQLSTPSTPSNLLTAFASPHPRVLTLDGASRS